jgi:type II restriction enzyme
MPDGPRTLVYNRKVPFLGKKGKNVDLCLLRCEPTDVVRTIKSPNSYIALGELKGGIDPAGADEHWKTAYAALSRIHRAFGDLHLEPHTFFIGAAIEEEMAVEIWDMLEEGEFENAANLTDDDQIASVTHWLCSL